MSHSANRTPRAFRFLFENSLFLVAGAIAALVWANLDKETYETMIHFDVRQIVGIEVAKHGADGHGKADGHAKTDAHDKTDSHAKKSDHDKSHGKNDADKGKQHGTDADTKHGKGEKKGEHDKHGAAGGHDSHAAHGLTIHFIVNDILMALFFAIAAKEVWESLLPGGALSNPKKAATPLMATLGGIVAPAGLYLAGAAATGTLSSFGQGWAVPCATDIAFSYLAARIIFGAGHPAIAFLLLLAIADDAAGLLILAIAYPSKPIEPTWLLLAVGAIALAFALRRCRAQSHWWYLLGPGVLCWISFYMAGIHPALGLVPIIPCMPSAHSDLGIFARDELHRDDTLNAFEHWWKNPVELILGAFGLVNAGVVLSSVGTGTWLVLLGLIIGKPLGITLFTWISEKVFGLEMPEGMTYRHIVTLGSIAALGFTVALFVAGAAFKQPGPIQDSIKMGALMSFGAALIAYIVGRALGIRPEPVIETKDAHGGHGQQNEKGGDLSAASANADCVGNLSS